MDVASYSPPFTCLTGVRLERGAATTLNGRELFFLYTTGAPLDPYQKASLTKKSVAKFGLSRLLAAIPWLAIPSPQSCGRLPPNSRWCERSSRG